MEEKNYLVIEIYPLGGQRIIAQTEQIDDALLLLGQLISRYDNPRNLFAVRTVYVNGSESVSRYVLEENWKPEEEEDIR
ncbi:MAG: hypothetical protein J6V44_13075 [Methanobrevibacter sp.]|nr:hypothetical protein [Methanobrevibacter sp.]MBO7696797.1 hypothetical protein [Methanobrevibacter sp.]